MSDLAIKAAGLGKRYQIGGQHKQHHRLGDMLVDNLLSPMRRAGKLLRGQASGAAELDETIWALKDVSFEIEQGDTVGIIGRNGAGKSTLLKVLSRITEPTEGYADVYGRVGSLLEVGTGFHPELTGRENVYLNGAILGMKRDEIGRKFDEIVAFAELEKFIDTPVKHYSSGMYVRLAFSVAAHLEPEILLVDEVLAVGDSAFQKKCLGKMDDVSQEGRTVLFVSHNMGLIQTLCRHAYLLERGHVTSRGRVSEVVSDYLNTLERVQTIKLAERTDRQGVGKVRLIDVNVSDGRTPPAHVLKTGGPARFVFQVNNIVEGMDFFVDVLDELGRPVTKFKTDTQGTQDKIARTYKLEYVCEVDELMLVPGRYQLDVLIRGRGEWLDYIEGVAFFDVETGELQGRSITRDTKRPVSLVMPYRWSVPSGG